MTTICGCGHERAIHKHGTDSCGFQICGCYEFIADVAEWKEAKACWDSEDAEDDRIWDEVYRQEQSEREDNEPPSGSTDFDNSGGIKFNY